MAYRVFNGLLQLKYNQTFLNWKVFLLTYDKLKLPYILEMSGEIK